MAGGIKDDRMTPTEGEYGVVVAGLRSPSSQLVAHRFRVASNESLELSGQEVNLPYRKKLGYDDEAELVEGSQLVK